MQRSLSLVIALCILTSCSPRRLYDGPERPGHEVGTIAASGASLTVDGVSDGVLSNGFQVLPGSHSLVINFTFSDPVRGVPCRLERRFDSYGYRECLRQQDEDYDRDRSYIRECEEWQFTERIEICLENVYHGSCTGSLEVSPGAEYHISWQRAENTEVILLVNGGDAKGRDISHSCSVSAPQVVEKERNIGN